MPRKAIIIGAGPAGLTAAYELLKRTDIQPIILEKSGDIGGISKTVNYKGNRIDIGGHRFFSKSDRVMQWWMNIMPVETSDEETITIKYHGQSTEIHADTNILCNEKRLLVRNRLSRIYFLRTFFSYPIKLSLDTLRKLGLVRTLRIIASYLIARLFPRKSETTLEDFFINRFGKQLYLLFFKDYTEKVWGVSCTKISAEWGAQRIKGISIGKAFAHALRSINKRKSNDVGQKNTETSLIEKFLYPKYGPGQLWEEVARQIREMGGCILMHTEVSQLHTENGKITSVETIDHQKVTSTLLEGDYFFSTMPVKELVEGLRANIPQNIQKAAAGLQYRDFITVGVLLKKMTVENLSDTWIYIQEKDVKVGRLQLFNNWSPYMVKDPDTIWIGMEYFCNDWDAFWNQSDWVIKKQAIDELIEMGLASAEDVLDTTVIRMEKAYPAYFGTYGEFDSIRAYIDKFENLFLIGRNGMHKYNNSDHSMLTAMVAVDNICQGSTEKANIWSINTEPEYHEQKQAPKKATPAKFPNALPNHTHAYMWIVAFSMLVQWLIFKWIFPYPNFIPDSLSYIYAAANNLDINFYPVGYSKILRLVNTFSKDAFIFTTFQYVFLDLSALYLFFTLSRHLPLKKPVRIAAFCFIVLNPIFLPLANYITSDAVFISFSFIWFAQLLNILYDPKPLKYLYHALVLLALLNIRFNALYYPFLSLVAVLYSTTNFRWKFLGTAILASTVFLVSFNTQNLYKQLTGHREFSGFSGWQLANNALIAYSKTYKSDPAPIPERFRTINTLVTKHFDTIQSSAFPPPKSISAYYLWNPHSPLTNYLYANISRNKSHDYFTEWSSLAPLYSDYAKHIIFSRPIAFTRYFLLPNVKNYSLPPGEFLSIYNWGKDTIERSAQNWFNLKSNKLYTRSRSKMLPFVDLYSPLVGVINLIFVLSLLGMTLLNGFKKVRPTTKRFIVMATALWILNLTFSVFASPITLRFQIFPVIITFYTSLLLIQVIQNTEGRKTTVKSIT